MRHAAPSILAIDLGTKCGWALLSQGKIVSGTFDMTPVRGERDGVRFLKFRREFLGTFNGVREVYFEEVHRHLGTQAAHIYGGLWAILCEWCEQHTIPMKGLAVGTIKKHVTGKGTAKKGAMIAAMKARGFEPEDDNEADALAILSLARKLRGAA